MLLSCRLELFNILVKTTCSDKLECHECHLFISLLAPFFSASYTSIVLTSAVTSEGKLLCLFPSGSSTPVMLTSFPAPSAYLHQSVGSSRREVWEGVTSIPTAPKCLKLFSHGVRCKPNMKLSGAVLAAFLPRKTSMLGLLEIRR